jgi:hypothetical protein
LQIHSSVPVHRWGYLCPIAASVTRNPSPGEFPPAAAARGNCTTAEYVRFPRYTFVTSEINGRV